MMMQSIPAPAVYLAAAAMGAAIATMGGAIAAMWMYFQGVFKVVQRKLDECETDRNAIREEHAKEKDEMWEEINRLTGDAVRAETCPAPKCPIRLAFPHRSVAAKQQERDGS